MVNGPVLSPPSEQVAAAPPVQIREQIPEIKSDSAIKETPVETREVASQTIVPVIPETPPEAPKIPEPAKEPEVTEIDPRLFLDKPIEDIAVLLGAADFARIEGKMGIWQYRQTQCVVDFFFYLESPDTPLSSASLPWIFETVSSASRWMKKIAAKRFISANSSHTSGLKTAYPYIGNILIWHSLNIPACGLYRYIGHVK